MSRVETMFGPRESWGKGGEMATVRERAVRQEGGGTQKGRKDNPSVGKADSSPERGAKGNGTGAVPYGKDGAKEKKTAGEKRAVKGFVSIKCPECGKVHNTCLHEDRTIFNCKACGQPVPMEDLRSIKMDCPRCRFKARYLTNRQEKLIQMECLNCSQPVNFRKGFRRGNYVVEGEA